MTNSNIDIVSIIDTATNKIIGKVPVGDNPIGIAVTQDGKTVYVANFYSNDVSIIDTATNKVKYDLDVETNPVGVAINKDGTRVYVANLGSGTVSVIDAANRTVLDPVPVGPNPYGVAVTPDERKVYVTHANSDKVSIIDTDTNNVTTINTGNALESLDLSPSGVAVSPDGKNVYVANHKRTIKGISGTPSGTVSVIDTATDSVVANVTVDKCPCGISVNKDGIKVYVANSESDTVSVIYTENYTVEYVPVGDMPSALGQFIGSPPKVPKHNIVREFIDSVVESINRTYLRINGLINGVQGFFLGIISSIFYGVLSGLIVPKITEKLDP
nr:beta-propeller fold lactonase family protein [Methanosarcina thermophila]